MGNIKISNKELQTLLGQHNLKRPRVPKAVSTRQQPQRRIPAVAKGASARAKKDKAKARARPVQSSNIFSPWNPALVPTIASEGKAFPAKGRSLIEHKVDASLGKRTLLLVTNNGHSSTNAVIWTQGLSPTFHSIATVDAVGGQGGPTSGRAMKCGLNIVNSTQFTNRGGRVYILNATSRQALVSAPSLMTEPQLAATMDEIKAHQDSTPYEAQEFAGDGKKFMCHPTDDSDYHFYSQWSGRVTDIDKWFSHVAAWPGYLAGRRPMSAFWVVIEVPSADQDYTFAVHSAYYTRWTSSTLAGQSNISVPTAAAGALNAHATRAQEVGSKALSAIEAGGAVGGATYAARAYQAMRAGNLAAAGEAVEMGALSTLAPAVEMVPLPLLEGALLAL